jgi:hypothetical protein
VSKDFDDHLIPSVLIVAFTRSLKDVVPELHLHEAYIELHPLLIPPHVDKGAYEMREEVYRSD